MKFLFVIIALVAMTTCAPYREDDDGLDNYIDDRFSVQQFIRNLHPGFGENLRLKKEAGHEANSYNDKKILKRGTRSVNNEMLHPPLLRSEIVLPETDSSEVNPRWPKIGGFDLNGYKTY